MHICDIWLTPVNSSRAAIFTPGACRQVSTQGRLANNQAAEEVFILTNFLLLLPNNVFERIPHMARPTRGGELAGRGGGSGGGVWVGRIGGRVMRGGG